MKAIIKTLVRKIPLVSGLADCRLRDHKEALHEIVLTLLGAVFPTLLGAITLILTAKESLWGKAILSNISNGELYLYCTSLVAPIIYIATADKQGDSEFPTKRSHITIIFILIGVSSLAFGLQKAGAVLNIETFFSISMFCFIFSIILLYLAIAYKNKMMPKGPEDMKQQEKTFADAYASHRR